MCASFLFKTTTKYNQTLPERLTTMDLLLSRLPAVAAWIRRPHTLVSLSCSLSGEFKQHTRFFDYEDHTLLFGFLNHQQSSSATFLRLKIRTTTTVMRYTIELTRYCQLLVHNICHTTDCEAHDDARHRQQPLRSVPEIEVRKYNSGLRRLSSTKLQRRRLTHSPLLTCCNPRRKTIFSSAGTCRRKNCSAD